MTAKGPVRYFPRHSASANPDHGQARSVGAGAGAVDRVVREIISGLYEGRFEPGQRLVESHITSSLGISRGPVREAYKAMASMGVVDLTLQRGAHIRVLTVQEAIDVLTVAQSLLGTAARLAAQFIDRQGARERLEDALGAISAFDPSSEAVEFARRRDGFYAALTAIGGNAELRRILPTLQVHLIRVQFRSTLRGGDHRRLADYRRIADAVLAGKAAAAEAAVRQHLQVTITALGKVNRSDRLTQPI